MVMTKIGKIGDNDREQRWGPDQKWWVGRMNDSEFVRGCWRFPSEVRLVDATLREGEEVPGTRLELTTKLGLAERIVDAGVRELEVGYAGVIDEHFDLIKALKKEALPARISSHTRLYGKENEWKAEIDRNLEAGADMLTLVGFCNAIGTVANPWLPPASVPDRIRNMVEYAKGLGAKVGFGLADVVRTSFANTLACYGAAAECGVDRVYIYDGIGALTPECTEYLTRLFKDITGPGVEIAVHCHNMFGLAVANSLRALLNGATCVDVVALGLGDGAGIAALEEVAGALEVLYGVETGIDLEALVGLCEAVAQAFGIPMPKTKAVVGENLYRHQNDSHVTAIMRGAWDSWEIVRPEVFGRKRKLEFGFSKLRRGRSGAIYTKMEQMGYEPSDAELDLVFGRIRSVTVEKGFASEEEVEAIIRKELGSCARR